MGTITHEGKRTSFALVLNDEARPNAANIPDISTELNGLHSSTSTHNTSGKFSMAANVPKPTLVKPEIFDFADKSKVIGLDYQLHSLLKAATPQIIVLCPAANVYAYVCERLGIGRAEHIALCGDVFGEERKRTIRSVNVGQKFLQCMAHDNYILASPMHQPDKSYEIAKNIYDDWVESHMRPSKKFYFDEKYIQNPLIEENDKHISEMNLRLPYKSCFFEFETAFWGNGIERVFLLLSTENGPTGPFYRAMAASMHSGTCRLHDCVLEWQYGNEGLELRMSGLVSDNELLKLDPNTMGLLEVNAQMMIDFMCPALEQINRPTTTLIKQQTQGRNMGRAKGSPYFDYYHYKVEDFPRDSIFNRTKVIRDYASEYSDRKDPAAHEREAHWRTYRDRRYINVRGMKVWIESCLVGDAKNGALDKSFATKNAGNLLPSGP